MEDQEAGYPQKRRRPPGNGRGERAGLSPNGPGAAAPRGLRARGAFVSLSLSLAFYLSVLIIALFGYGKKFEDASPELSPREERGAVVLRFPGSLRFLQPRRGHRGPGATPAPVNGGC